MVFKLAPLFFKRGHVSKFKYLHCLLLRTLHVFVWWSEALSWLEQYCSKFLECYMIELFFLPWHGSSKRKVSLVWKSEDFKVEIFNSKSIKDNRGLHATSKRYNLFRWLWDSTQRVFRRSRLKLLPTIRKTFNEGFNYLH